MEKKLEVIYTWPDGKEDIRYTRDYPSPLADDLIKQVDALEDSRYSYRIVDTTHPSVIK